MSNNVTGDVITAALWNAKADILAAGLVSGMTQILGNMGYVRLPGGVLIQWARQTIVTSAASVTPGTVINWPVPFLTAMVASVTLANNGYPKLVGSIYAVSNTTVRPSLSTGDGTTTVSVAAAGFEVHIIGIGS